MKARWIGLLTGASTAFVIDLLILKYIDINTRTGTNAWWLVNFPSFPLVLCCLPFIGSAIAFGDDNQPLVNLLSIYCTFASCLTWGGMGYWVGRANEKSKPLDSDGEAEGSSDPSDPARP